jgi:hypothetical protein
VSGSFRLECFDAAGHVAAVATESGGALVIQGDLRLWRDVAADLLPHLREAAAESGPAAP